MIINIDSIISEGYIFGNIYKNKIKQNVEKKIFVESEKLKIREAIKQALIELESIKATDQNLIDYLFVQKLMISDASLVKSIDKRIDSGLSAVDSLSIVVDELQENLRKSKSSYLRARTSDFEDIYHRIEKYFIESHTEKRTDKFILVTDKMFPSLLIEERDNILGIIAKEGGYSSHSAIIARSLDIPYVIYEGEIECDNVIIDTRKSVIITDPSNEDIEAFKQEYSIRLSMDKKAVVHKGFGFYANVQSNEDVAKALEYGFDGVGLYRTEMIFMNLDRAYTKEEQASIYCEAAEIMKDKTICFRTFDVGDDKKLSYLRCNTKSIDNYLNNRSVFETQIEAMLIANKYNNVRIMFPMIENKDEFNLLRRWVLRIQERHGYNKPLIGMMLESKNALDNINTFENPDFISIGTNDLSKSLYGIDRENGPDPETYASDLINKLKPVVEYCDKNNVKLSVCGELAAIKKDALRFYRIGIRNLSVTPRSVRMLNIAYNEFKEKN